jgi:hypothetical protein
MQEHNRRQSTLWRGGCHGRRARARLPVTQFGAVRPCSKPGPTGASARIGRAPAKMAAATIAATWARSAVSGSPPSIAPGMGSDCSILALVADDGSSLVPGKKRFSRPTRPHTSASPTNTHARPMTVTLSPSSSRPPNDAFIPDSCFLVSVSHRHEAVLLRRVAVHLGPQDFQRIDQPQPCVAGLDHLVDLAYIGGCVGVMKGIYVVL